MRAHSSSTARTMTKANSTTKSWRGGEARGEGPYVPYCSVRRNPTGWARPGPGRHPGWRQLLRSRLDYTVLVRSHHTAMTQWVLMGSGFWNDGRAQDGQGSMGRGCHFGWGVLPRRILFRYPRRLRIGSRRHGRGRGRFVDCDSFVKARERKRKGACLSIGLRFDQCHVSHLSIGNKMRDGWLFGEIP